MSPHDLSGFLRTERERIDDALERAAPASRRDGDGAVAAAVRYAVESGGKRLRPVLCIAAYRAVAGEPPVAVYDLAAAIELIHTYSLVHDDLPSMDDDAVRRGRPATHVAHGVVAATLAGAALIPLAARVAERACEALGLSDAATGEAVATLMESAGAGGMVGGQALDLEAEARTVALEELERVHALKTGALLSASPRLGGIAAGADPATVVALGAYGAALGLAFQVTDDILDVTSSTAVLGKTAGRDTELAKATYPALLGLDGARERAEAEADRAQGALRGAGIRSWELEALARYAVERDR